MGLIKNIMYNIAVIFKVLVIPIDNCSLVVNLFTAAFAPTFIKGVQLFVIVYFGCMAVFRVVVAQISVYDADKVLCVQTGQLRTIYIALHACLGMIELSLSAVCVIPYSYKLLKVMCVLLFVLFMYKPGSFTDL